MTKEEALIELKRDIHNAKVTHHLLEHYEIAIKALEQENTLDKIRTEIEDLDRFYDNDCFSENRDSMLKCNEVLQIIDKYTESEE